MDSPDFYLAEGDVLPVIKGALTWADDAAVDLTGATVMFQVRPRNKHEDVFLATADIVGPPTQGNVQYQWIPSDTDLPGDFDARWVVIFPSGKQASFPNSRKLLLRIDSPIGEPPSGVTGGVIPFVPSVADIAALGGIDATNFGQTYRVRTVRALFYLDPDSTLTPDGKTVVTAPAGGRWLRMAPGDLYWQNQIAWFYDAATGDDENTGLDSGHPLQTMAELWRRLQGSTLMTDVDITIAGGPGTLSDDELEIFDALSFGLRTYNLI